MSSRSAQARAGRMFPLRRRSQPARAVASASAVLAPWPLKGDMGCAASPSTVTTCETTTNVPTQQLSSHSSVWHVPAVCVAQQRHSARERGH